MDTSTAPTPATTRPPLDLKDNLIKNIGCIVGLVSSCLNYDPKPDKAKDFNELKFSCFASYIFSIVFFIILKKIHNHRPNWISSHSILFICNGLFFFGWVFYVRLNLNYILHLRELGVPIVIVTILDVLLILINIYLFF
jgi:hypothetical protein